MNNYNLHFTPFLDCFIKYLYERWHGNKNTHIYSSLKPYLSTQSILLTKLLKCFTMCYSLFSNGVWSDYKGWGLHILLSSVVKTKCLRSLIQRLNGICIKIRLVYRQGTWYLIRDLYMKSFLFKLEYIKNIYLCDIPPYLHLIFVILQFEISSLMVCCSL